MLYTHHAEDRESIEVVVVVVVVGVLLLLLLLSEEVRESTRVVLGDVPKKGEGRCSLDSCLLNPGNLSPSTTLLRY